MPTISHRGEVMPASPIRKLVPLANKAKEKGIKVFHLNIGQPDLPTPQIGLDALRHMHRRILEYSPSEGIKSLREKLVQYYDKFHIHVTADDISSPQEALRLYYSHSWLVWTPAMKLLFQNRHTPTTWHSLSRPEQ